MLTVRQTTSSDDDDVIVFMIWNGNGWETLKEFKTAKEAEKAIEPMVYSADNRNFFDTEREARQRKLDDAIAELKALSAEMFDGLMSIRVTQ